MLAFAGEERARSFHQARDGRQCPGNKRGRNHSSHIFFHLPTISIGREVEVIMIKFYENESCRTFLKIEKIIIKKRGPSQAWSNVGGVVRAIPPITRPRPGFSSCPYIITLSCHLHIVLVSSWYFTWLPQYHLHIFFISTSYWPHQTVQQSHPLGKPS